MSLYKIEDPILAGAPVAVTQVDSSTPRFPLGLIARGEDKTSGTARIGAGQFVYLQGSNAASVGMFVNYSANQAVLVGTGSTSSPGPLAVVCAVLTATSHYGWAQVQGLCDFARGTDSSVAAGAGVYIPAATDGIGVGPAATSDGVVLLGARVRNACFNASYTSSQSLSQSLYLMFPYVGGLTASQ